MSINIPLTLPRYMEIKDKKSKHTNYHNIDKNKSLEWLHKSNRHNKMTNEKEPECTRTVHGTCNKAKEILGY